LSKLTSIDLYKHAFIVEVALIMHELVLHLLITAKFFLGMLIVLLFEV